MQKVEELISQRRWNRCLVFKIFSKEDAENVLTIPINLVDREDSNFWKHSLNGVYSVSSGYKVLKGRGSSQQRDLQMGGETSWESNRQKMWKGLWSLKIKHKLKLFLWKCINEALPVRQAIVSKTRKGDPICRSCGDEVETIEHALLNCNRAKDIWQISPIQWDEEIISQVCFGKWWATIAEARLREEGERRLALTVYIL